MIGPQVLAATLSERRYIGNFPLPIHYHSRSDRHSKVACWGVVADLLIACEPLRRQASTGDVVFGINHEMRDFVQNRKKKLDLVIATPNGSSPQSRRPTSLRGLAAYHGIVLDDDQRHLLLELPDLSEGPVGSVRVALEAKAAMTAFGKAQPRLYDELNSSQATVHGASSFALAVGFVMVNTATRFMSTDSNKHLERNPELPLVVSEHAQPRDALGIIDKVKQLPRRTRPANEGFDGLAIVPVDCMNLPPPAPARFQLVTAAPYATAVEGFEYRAMINRVAAEYASRFGHP